MNEEEQNQEQSEGEMKTLFQFETVDGEEKGGNKHKPHFSVKMNRNFVGSAWLQDGKFGKYVSVAINHDVPKGSRIYINPTRENAMILG
ncbi:MAG: hypothetical protein V1722_05890 [Candidatus Micrarchaeota archaeon]